MRLRKPFLELDEAVSVAKDFLLGRRTSYVIAKLITPCEHAIGDLGINGMALDLADGRRSKASG